MADYQSSEHRSVDRQAFEVTRVSSVTIGIYRGGAYSSGTAIDDDSCTSHTKEDIRK